MKVIVDYSQGSDLIRIAANPTHSGSYCCHLGNGKVFLLFMTFIYYVSISKSTWGHCSHDINPACEQIHNMTLSKGVLSTHHTVDEALFMVWTPHPSNVCAAEKVTKVWTAIVRSPVYLQVNVTPQRDTRGKTHMRYKLSAKYIRIICIEIRFKWLNKNNPYIFTQCINQKRFVNYIFCQHHLKQQREMSHMTDQHGTCESVYRDEILWAVFAFRLHMLSSFS